MKTIAIAVVFALLVAGCSDDPITTATSSKDPYKYSSSQDYTYSVGDHPLIVAETFIGSIDFNEADQSDVDIRITKWADDESNLELLDISLNQVDSQINVVAANPENLDNVAVDIEITGPPESLLDLATDIGQIFCSGQPGDTWDAESGIGSVKLVVPAGVNIAVELIAGVGSVEIDFDVDGEVSDKQVIGTIGSGDEGEITAYVGVGSISLTSQ